MSQVSFPVTHESFQALVERSADVPVLLDFWADWCEPCKAFAPVLDRVAEEYGGAFLLGKVDTEAQQELAHAFQVQSIPFGVLLSKGRPVDMFRGALSEPELRAFLTKHGVRPAREAEDAELDPTSAEAILIAACRSAMAGDVAGSRRALADIAEDDPLYGERCHLEEGLEFLEAPLDDGSPAMVALGAARERLAEGDLEAGLQGILASAEADRSVGLGLARKGMLLCQAVHGADHQLVDAYRRRLATLLY